LFTESNVSPKKLSTMLRTLRGKKGLTQEQVARAAGVTRFYVSQLEGGLRKNPSLPVLKRLAKALGVPVTELLG
jgi:transcriptional regulator with XRE-family HTH domain